MTEKELLYQLTPIFKSVFDDDTIVLSRETIADDIVDWDSITHVHLLVAIEKHFNIKLSSTSIPKYEDLGELCDAIFEKLNA
jgi:acyl carrier protein